MRKREDARRREREADAPERPVERDEAETQLEDLEPRADEAAAVKGGRVPGAQQTGTSPET